MSANEHLSFIERLVNNGYKFDVFYDVGANVGGWSAKIQQVCPDARYEMFEPLAGRLSELDERAVHHTIKNGALHRVALSDKTGPAQLKVLGPRGVGSSVLIQQHDYKKDINIISISAARMDDFVAANGLLSPDFIKIDTQAGELKVLEGGEQTIAKAKFILLETWLRRVYGPETPLFHEISHWLYSRGFVLYEILINEGRDEDQTLRWFDAVYINKSVSKFPKSML